jgi:hypothetical protein
MSPAAFTSYEEVLIPPWIPVCGVRLHPLTVGHLFVLARLGSPFVDRGEGVSRGAGDIGLFLWVCSRPWISALQHLGSWRARIRIRRFARAAVGAEETLSSEILTWLYLQYRGPKMRRRKGASDDAPLGAPDHALFKVSLMTELGLSAQEALDCSVSLAVWDLAVVAERKGALTIVSGEVQKKDSEFFAEALRVAAENRAAKAGSPSGVACGPVETPGPGAGCELQPVGQGSDRHL